MNTHVQSVHKCICVGLHAHSSGFVLAHSHKPVYARVNVCICVCICIYWLPLWSSGQSSCLQIRRPGFHSRRYQIFWEVVGLEQGPLSLVSIIEELLERKSSGSGLESQEYGRRDSSCWPRGTLYKQILALTSPTSGGRSVGKVC
jgi:hypothetical protein